MSRRRELLSSLDRRERIMTNLLVTLLIIAIIIYVVGAMAVFIVGFFAWYDNRYSAFGPEAASEGAEMARRAPFWPLWALSLVSQMFREGKDS